MAKDFYDILGVSKNASEQELKSAYRKKALKYHPDRMAGKSPEEAKKAEATFKEINEAYTTLSNPDKKRAYDQYGDANAAGNPFGGGFDTSGFPDLSDILNNFFHGGQQSGPQSFQGDDRAYTMTLSLEEAASGVEKTISVTKKDPCTTCHGSGCNNGSQPTVCSHCNGTGKVTMRHGMMAIQQVCPSCHGEGFIIADPCQKCHGKGRYNQSSKIKVRIPSGVDTGDRMRVAGKGDAGIRNAQPGDLYININVSKHALFTREGAHLHCNVPISFYQACIGGKVEIATLTGTVALNIPPETQSGSLLRLKQKGIRSVKTNQIGDIICKVIVETPVKLTSEQKSMIQDFDKSIEKNQKHRPKAQSFMERIKHMFGA